MLSQLWDEGNAGTSLQVLVLVLFAQYRSSISPLSSGLSLREDAEVMSSHRLLPPLLLLPPLCSGVLPQPLLRPPGL